MTEQQEMCDAFARIKRLLTDTARIDSHTISLVCAECDQALAQTTSQASPSHLSQGALKTLTDFVERSTHWREGGATRHDALTALRSIEAAGPARQGAQPKPNLVESDDPFAELAACQAQQAYDRATLSAQAAPPQFNEAERAALWRAFDDSPKQALDMAIRGLERLSGAAQAAPIELVLDALRDGLSVCTSVSTSDRRKIVRDGITLYAQTDDWCNWAESEVGPKLRSAIERMTTTQASGRTGGDGEPVNRNDPVSALAIRILVALEKVSQNDADHAFRLACEALEDEARRMNVELPWVVRAPCAAPPAILEQASYRVDDEVQLRSAVSVMDDVLTDIAGWEDQALAEAVRASRTDLLAMADSIKFLAPSQEQAQQPQAHAQELQPCETCGGRGFFDTHTPGAYKDCPDCDTPYNSNADIDYAIQQRNRSQS